MARLLLIIYILCCPNSTSPNTILDIVVSMHVLRVKIFLQTHSCHNYILSCLATYLIPRPIPIPSFSILHTETLGLGVGMMLQYLLDTLVLVVVIQAIQIKYSTCKHCIHIVLYLQFYSLLPCNFMQRCC